MKIIYLDDTTCHTMKLHDTYHYLFLFLRHKEITWRQKQKSPSLDLPVAI